METLEKVPLTVLSACKSVYVVPGVKVPVMVTDKRPLSVAVPETETLSAPAGTTLHCMAAAVVEKVRPPAIVSWPPLGCRDWAVAPELLICALPVLLIEASVEAVGTPLFQFAALNQSPLLPIQVVLVVRAGELQTAEARIRNRQIATDRDADLFFMICPSISD